MAKYLEQRRYLVNISVAGDAQRVVTAQSEDEALVKAKKMLFSADGQTPKTSLLEAFCWEVGYCSSHIHWRDMTSEEREAERAEREAAYEAICIAEHENDNGVGE